MILSLFPTIYFSIRILLYSFANPHSTFEIILSSQQDFSLLDHFFQIGVAFIIVRILAHL